MHTQQLTARFPTGDEMNAALADLRRSGAVCHTGAIPYDGIGPSPVLRFSVREADLCLARRLYGTPADEFSQGKRRRARRKPLSQPNGCQLLLGPSSTNRETGLPP